MSKYKFREDDLINEFKEYIDQTYDSHYSKDRDFQAFEFVVDSGHGTGFTIGDIMKYAQRYGHKGNHEDWRKDLMKIIHYGFLALYVHDREHRPLTKNSFTSREIFSHDSDKSKKEMTDETATHLYKHLANSESQRRKKLYQSNIKIRPDDYQGHQ